MHARPCASRFLPTDQALRSTSHAGNTPFYCLLVAEQNLLLHLPWVHRNLPAEQIDFFVFPFSTLFHFFFVMSLFPLLSYSISLSPSPFVFNLLILSHIHHLLLAEVLFALCLKTSIPAGWVPSPCLSLVIDQFTQTLKAMRPSGPSWPASPATTAPTRGAPLSTAAAAQVQPAFSPECRIARRCLALSYTALTYICPALFPAAQTTGCLLRQRSPSIFVLVCWLWKMGAPPEVLSLSQRRAWTADLALPEGQPG